MAIAVPLLLLMAGNRRAIFAEIEPATLQALGA
jgi:hypothetical protein